jgi:eukaryotic-like serine/threonine-protein kinase
MSSLYENKTNSWSTLAQLLADGPIPLPEAVRYAMMLAEALRQIHDSGRAYGTLLPSNVAVTTTGIELGVTPGQPAAITPYTAPEILQGQTPDSRSDIFAFGAIVYEMIMGRPAFAGDNADALAVSLTISGPPPSGTPAIDHLVSNCIAKDPAVRCQRMQKVILELKLLTFAPHAEAVTRQQTVTAALRAETHQLETRVAALLETHEKAIIDVQQSSGDAISELRGRLSKVEAEFAPVQSRAALLEELCQRIMTHVEQVQQNIEAIDERVTGLKDGIDALSEGATVLREYVGARMHEFEQTLKSQRTAIASVVASQAQTDDVVEGVVGAMELLHTIVFDHKEEMAELSTAPRSVEPTADLAFLSAM